MSKVALVTGGAGFIGSHLAGELIKQSIKVVVVDDLSAGRLHRIPNGCQFIQKRIQDTYVSELPDKLDIIYHLGEYSRVENSFNCADGVISNNLTACAEVLKIAREKNAKLIYSGSSTKFGDKGDNKYDSPYALSKYLNTEMVNSYAGWYRLKYAISYFYNVYGDGENSEGEFATVIAKFLKRNRDGKKLEIVSPGTQTRNFTHIDDTVDALILIGEMGNGDNYGIASDQYFTIKEVANMISDKQALIPDRKGNRMSAAVVSEKTKKLGWKPKRNLKAYLARAVL